MLIQHVTLKNACALQTGWIKENNSKNTKLIYNGRHAVSDFYSWPNSIHSYKLVRLGQQCCIKCLAETGFGVYLAWGANAEQLFLVLFWVQRMSHLGKGSGFLSLFGLLGLSTHQTFCDVRVALMMAMLLDSDLFFLFCFILYTDLTDVTN